MIGLERVAQRQFTAHFVVVASALFENVEVTGVAQLGDDPMRRALGMAGDDPLRKNALAAVLDFYPKATTAKQTIPSKTNFVCLQNIRFSTSQ